MMYDKLFRSVDNAPLIVFRIFFGLLLFAETLGAILTGWVKRVMVEPEFTFSHIGLEWLQPLPGSGMYFYFILMSILGLCVMIGLKYRYTLGGFTLLWAGAYLMQKETYNNHYYLLLLVCIIMLFLPANRYASVDAKLNPDKYSLTMPQWCSWVMILQVTIVYVFAVASKLYPDWLSGKYISILFSNLTQSVIYNPIFNEHWFHLFISWSGILFDLLIVPLLLWKRTRTIAFVAAILFHLFNAVALEIGIFPFFALSFTVFFYPAAKIRRLFLRKKPPTDRFDTDTRHKNILLYFFIPYFIIQLALPLRHHFIEGDVLWTEEGHRLSWRMMLRHKVGYSNFKVVDRKSGETWIYNYNKELNLPQRSFVSSKPDGIWQMARHIREKYTAEGRDVSVFVDCRISVNDGPYQLLIDPAVDLAHAEWNFFKHNEWVMLHDKELTSPR